MVDAQCYELHGLYIQDDTKAEEFNREDMDAADALFALAHQDSRNLASKFACGPLRSYVVSLHTDVDFATTLQTVFASHSFRAA